MTARSLMIQGTGSDVGKSLLVAGLCRIARRQGLKVAPFKPQNMSNNAAALENGGEIARAQALQALAAGCEPSVHHNPVLLKPESDRVSQIIVHGQQYKKMDAARFINTRDELLSAVLDSFDELAANNDFVLVEGAGSPAETNLRARDIANMGFARAAGVPVCLVGDIERGGVIASLIGTHTVLDPLDAAMIKGFAVNKFRGDPTLFDDGVTTIEHTTGWPCFGVIPWLPAAARLPAEDAITAMTKPLAHTSTLKIVAPMLSRMANFDDADPLRLEPRVDFEFIPPGKPLPRDADLIILFGTKSTLGELAFIKEQGWDHDIIAHARAGGRVLGICGGYQMLGRSVADPEGLDGRKGVSPGLGLLNVDTVMAADKTVRRIAGECSRTNTPLSGYEIHLGYTTGADCSRPLIIHNDGNSDGATSLNGRVQGTYIHGLLREDLYRSAFLQHCGEVQSELAYDAMVDAALNEVADHFAASLNIEQLFASAAIAEPTGG